MPLGAASILLQELAQERTAKEKLAAEKAAAEQAARTAVEQLEAAECALWAAATLPVRPSRACVACSTSWAMPPSSVSVCAAAMGAAGGGSEGPSARS